MDDNVLAPKHLAASTRGWWDDVLETYVLEPHQVLILQLAGETWDRKEEARRTLATEGITYLDRFDQPKSRPEVAIERDCRIAFARLIRELALDIDDPQESRPPTLT